MIAAISVEGLFELIWVAPLAVLVVASSFSLALLGATRTTEHRREGSRAAAAGYAALAALAGLVFASTVVAGLSVIIAG